MGNFALTPNSSDFNTDRRLSKEGHLVWGEGLQPLSLHATPPTPCTHTNADTLPPSHHRWPSAASDSSSILIGVATLLLHLSSASCASHILNSGILLCLHRC